MIEKKLNVKTCLFPIIFGAVAAIGCWAFVTPNDFASAGIEGVHNRLEGQLLATRAERSALRVCVFLHK